MSAPKTRIIILDPGINIVGHLPRTLEGADISFIDNIQDAHKYPNADILIAALVLSHAATAEVCSKIVKNITATFPVSIFIEASSYNKSHLNDLGLQSVHSLFSSNKSMGVVNIDFMAESAARSGVYKVEHFADNIAFDSKAPWVVPLDSPRDRFPPAGSDKPYHIFDRPAFEWSTWVCHKFNASDVDISRDLTLVEARTNFFRAYASGLRVEKNRHPTEIGTVIYKTPQEPESILKGRVLSTPHALWSEDSFRDPKLQPKILEWNSYLEGKTASVSVSELPNCVIGGSGAVFSDGNFVRGTEHLSRFLHSSVLDPTYSGLMRRHPAQHIRGISVMGFNLLYSNYYHWVAEIMTSISLSVDLLKEPSLNKITLITGSLNSFRRQFLDILFEGDSRIELVELAQNEFVTTDSTLYCSNLASAPGQPELLLECIPFIEKIAHRANLNTVKPHRLIYVSRRDTKARVVLNEEALIERLKVLGFEIFVATGTSVLEQIHVFNESKLIVAPHGAGITNVLFAQPGSVILELKQSTYLNTCMARLAQIAGVRYFSEIVFPQGEENSDKSWSVDIGRVEAAIQQLLPG